MFVQTNTIQALKAYFTDRLKTRFSENEIKYFFYESVVERLALSKTALLFQLSNDCYKTNRFNI